MYLCAHACPCVSHACISRGLCAWYRLRALRRRPGAYPVRGGPCAVSVRLDAGRRSQVPTRAAPSAPPSSRPIATTAHPCRGLCGVTHCPAKRATLCAGIRGHVLSVAYHHMSPWKSPLLINIHLRQQYELQHPPDARDDVTYTSSTAPQNSHPHNLLSFTLPSLHFFTSSHFPPEAPIHIYQQL